MSTIQAGIWRAIFYAFYIQSESPELEEQIAKVVATTTSLVHDGGDKDDLRQAFARLATLKSRRNPIDIYRLECLLNLETFL